jgi:hypothetical protein
MVYAVSETAIQNYNKIFYKALTKKISELVNEDFILFSSEGVASIKFFDSFAISSIIKDHEIIYLQKISYEVILPDAFLLKVKYKDNLPPRLDRIRDLGIISLREELKDSLQLGRIKLKDNTNYAYWEKYKIKFLIKDFITLEDLIVE